MRKTRKIVVEDVEYQWRVEELDWPEHEVRIWCKRLGKVQWCVVSFEEIGLVVRPALVSQIIRYASEKIPNDSSSTFRFGWAEYFGS